MIMRGAILLLALTISGCSESSTTSTTSPASPPATPAANSHRVVGAIQPAPKEGLVVVTLEPRPAKTAPPGSTPSMDQYGQTFVPAMLFVRTGHPVDFLNNDDVLHNVRVRNNATREAAFNVAIPVGEKYVYRFEADGLYEVGCDIHPSMSAVVVSTSTPFTAVADRDGRFAFENVEPGSYVVVASIGSRRVAKEIKVSGAETAVSLDAH
jgi:plastocyanin